MKDIITPLGRVALKPRTRIDISKNNLLFSRAEEFSLPLTIPRKPNEHIFGYKYRLASVGAIAPIDAQFIFAGREKLSGSIELVSASDENYEVLLKGGRNDFMFKAGKTRLQDINFGSENFVPGVTGPTLEEINDEMGATLTNIRDWICFPVYVGANWDGWKNAWDYDNNRFLDHAGNAVPFLRLYRAIERLFSFYSYTVDVNWFAGTAERKNIVMFCRGFMINGVLDISNMYPNWTVSEFISELEDFFPITFYINPGSRKVQILSDDTISSDAPVSSLDKYLDGKYKIVFNDTKSGYDLTYEYPDDDDSVKQDVNYSAEVAADSYDSKFSFPSASILSKTALSNADGQYYKAKESGETWVWERTGSVAINVRSGKGEITRKTKIYPMMNDVIKVRQEVTYLDGASAPMRFFADILQQSPVSYKPMAAWSEDLRLMIYRGMDSPVNNTNPVGYTMLITPSYPQANFVARKMNGTLWTDNVLELRWDGTMGLRGAETIAFLEGAEKVDVKLVLSHMDLEKLDTSKIYTLNGRKVMISELTIHYAEDSTVEVDAVLLAQGR